MKKGFTLVEVLIVVAVLGVIAAMSLPVLLHNIREKEYSAKAKVFNARFIESLNLARNAGDINSGYTSSYDFVKRGLSKHLKMSAICDSKNLQDCFGYDTMVFEDEQGKEKSIDVKNLKTKRRLNVKDSGFFNDTAAFVMADGTPVILTYKKDCEEDPSTANSTISPCIAGLYDLNGSRNPNAFINRTKDGKTEMWDIRSINSATPGTCTGFVGDLCLASTAQRSYQDMYSQLRSMDSGYNPRGIYGWRDNWQITNDYCKKIMRGHLMTQAEFNSMADEMEKSKSSVYSQFGIANSNNIVYFYLSEPKAPTNYAYRGILWLNSDGTVANKYDKHQSYSTNSDAFGICIGD